MSEVIMLAKQYDPKKAKFPAYVSEKLDGVAADFYTIKRLSGNFIGVRTRQDKPLHIPVAHIKEFLLKNLPKKAFDDNYHFIGELYIPGEDFKDISGKVRSQDEECPELMLFIYDMYIENTEIEYRSRWDALRDLFIGIDLDESPVQLVRQHLAENANDVELVLQTFKEPIEGVVVRQLRGPDSVYKIGRSKGMLKYKLTETADLEVVSIEEALDANGTPKGMVGRINCRYKGNTIGVGPGKLKHDERTAIFSRPDDYIGRIAEVAYMPDPSYDALREPRFLRWRDDKTKGE